MDPALAAYFAVNNACWDLVRGFGKRNCAKWKKGMCFSADERQIRGGETYTSIRTMEQQVKTCKGEGEHSGNYRRKSSNEVIIKPDLISATDNTLNWIGTVQHGYKRPCQNL